MVKLIFVLILLAGVIKIIEPGRYLEDQSILSAIEENKKGDYFDLKEKQEQDLAFPDFGPHITRYPGQSDKRPIDLQQYIPTCHHEPSSPPPNIIYS